MPSKITQEMMVANQMMKGPRPGRLDITPKQRENFKKRHSAQIQWVLARIPRNSAAVAAVMVRAPLLSTLSARK